MHVLGLVEILQAHKELVTLPTAVFVTFWSVQNIDGVGVDWAERKGRGQRLRCPN